MTVVPVDVKVICKKESVIAIQTLIDLEEIWGGRTITEENLQSHFLAYYFLNGSYNTTLQ